MLNADLNANHKVMEISKVISDLSKMEDDYDKVIKYEKLISDLEFEHTWTDGLSNQMPCSVYFLKEAIDRYKELRRACEFRVLSELARQTSEAKANMNKGKRPLENDVSVELSELARQTSEAKAIMKKGKRPLENDVSVGSSAGGSSGGKQREWWLGVVNSRMNKNK